MASIHRSALLPYSSDKLYAMVQDVEAYPQFMDGCVGAQILDQGEEFMEARLDLARGGIAQSFTTRNTLNPPHSIELSLAEGPFEHFAGAWHFRALAADAGKLTLDLEFSLRGNLLSLAASSLLDRVTGNLVDAVVKRAKEVYG